MSSAAIKLAIGAPITAAPTPTVTPQGPGGATTWTYQMVALDAGGNVTAGGTTGSTAVGIAFALAGDASFNRVTWTDVTNAVAYDLYRTAPGSTVYLARIASGVQVFDDHGYNGRPATVPAANVTGRSQIGHCQGMDRKTVEVVGAFSGGLIVEGTIDGSLWEQIGSTFVAQGYAKTDRAFSAIRGRWGTGGDVYVSGSPSLWVSGVGGGG